MPKSWDIRPSNTPAPQKSPKAKTRAYAEPTRKVVRLASPLSQEEIPERGQERTPARRTRPAGAGRGVVSLREKRKARQRNIFFLLALALCVLCLIGVIILWQPFIRVQNIEARGPHADELSVFVQSRLQGTHYGILPKNSIVFLPTEEIRSSILHQFPDIEAVSLSPSGLTTFSVSATGRASAFWWCGTAFTPERSPCFETDTGGKIFTPVLASSTSASSTPFIVYSPYQGALTADSPLGGVIVNSAQLGNMLRFVKTLKGLGAPIVSSEIRGDEADLYTGSGTRITYVLGREEQAAALAATSFPTLDVQGSSLVYIDLRFTSKVYFKKKGSVVGTDTKVR